MAKIPDASALGDRAIADGRRNYTPDRSAQILQGANEALGSIGNTFRRLAEHDDQYNYARAQTALQSADAALEKQLAEDADWQTHEDRYTEGMKAAREDAAKMIRGNRSRELFEIGAQGGIEHGQAKIRAQSKVVEGQEGRGELDSMLETTRRSALETTDPALRASLERASKDAIAGAMRKKYITAEQAVQMDQAWSQAFGEGFVGMQSPEEQMRILREPKGTPADRIDPAKRAGMLALAEHNGKVQQLDNVATTITKAFERDTVAGQAALKDLSKSGLSDADQLDVRARVRQNQGLLHAERRQEFAEQVNGLERRISIGQPGPNAELEAGGLYRKGVYTPEQYTNVLQSIDTARAKGAEDAASMASIENAVANGMRLDPKDTKIVKSMDAWFTMATGLNKVEPGSDEWVNSAATIASKTNILPPSAMSWARSNLLSGDPKLSVPAANAMTRWSEAAPAAYAYFDDPNMKAFAEQVDSLVRAGASPDNATAQANENVYTMPKERRERIEADYKKQKYAADNAGALKARLDSDDSFDRALFSGAPEPSTDAGTGARAMGEEYELLVRSYFNKTNGDIGKARDLAWKDIRGTYGYSTVNGAPEILKYAPEVVFPGIDTAVIRSDIEESATAAWVTGPVRMVPSRKTGDTHGLMWNLATTDEDGHAEVLLDDQNRAIEYAIPTDTATYVKAHEEMKRTAVQSARSESKRRRELAEGQMKIGAYPVH